jgi:hypothetical protein
MATPPAEPAAMIGLAQIVYEFTHVTLSPLCYPSIRSKEPPPQQAHFDRTNKIYF